MIRPASLRDVERIAKIGERFHAEAGWGDVAGYNRADTAKTLAFMVCSPDCVLLVCDKGGELIGMAGGMFLVGTATASQTINFVWQPLYGWE